MATEIKDVTFWLFSYQFDKFFKNNFYHNTSNFNSQIEIKNAPFWLSRSTVKILVKQFLLTKSLLSRVSRRDYNHENIFTRVTTTFLNKSYIWLQKKISCLLYPELLLSWWARNWVISCLLYPELLLSWWARNWVNSTERRINNITSCLSHLVVSRKLFLLVWALKSWLLFN